MKDNFTAIIKYLNALYKSVFISNFSMNEFFSKIRNLKRRIIFPSILLPTHFYLSIPDRKK